MSIYKPLITNKDVITEGKTSPARSLVSGKILDSLRLPVSLVSCEYFPLYQTGESKHYITRPVSLEKWQVSPAKYNYIRYVIM